MRCLSGTQLICERQNENALAEKKNEKTDNDSLQIMTYKPSLINTFPTKKKNKTKKQGVFSCIFKGKNNLSHEIVLTKNIRRYLWKTDIQ